MSDLQKVCVVDDEPSTCRAIQRLLRVAGYDVDAFSSPTEFLASESSREADCFVLDVHMPGLDGFAVQEKLADRANPPSIVFLTGGGDVPMSVRAMRAGAANFLLKPVDEDALIGAIRTAIAETRSNNDAVEIDLGLQTRLDRLTARERDVLQVLLTGAMNKQIAEALQIAERTVKMHRARIMRKLGAKSLLDLAPYRNTPD